MNDATNSATDTLVANNQRYAESFGDGDLPGAPAMHIAVVTCMDARMDVTAMLGLANGDAHVIRNAGGVVTDDVIRSLCLSQRALGTREIMVVHHTRCGVQNVDEAGLRSQLESETGLKPTWSVEGFADPFEDVRQSMRRVTSNPFLPRRESVRGFVYDVDDGSLHEVTLDT